MTEPNPVHILLIEDNPGDAFLMRDAFSHSKLETQITTVNDGEMATDYMQDIKAKGENHHPDMIILDLNMPKKDGHEVLGELKSDPALRHIPVIVMSSSRAETDATAVFALQADEFMVKPSDLEEYSTVVRNIETLWNNNWQTRKQ